MTHTGTRDESFGYSHYGGVDRTFCLFRRSAFRPIIAGSSDVTRNVNCFAHGYTASIRRVLATRLCPEQGPLPTGSGLCAFWPINIGVSRSRRIPATRNHVTGYRPKNAFRGPRSSQSLKSTGRGPTPSRERQTASTHELTSNRPLAELEPETPACNGITTPVL